MDKKTGRKSYARTVTEYRERKAAIEQDARDALDAERGDRAAASPDPATVLNTATGPRTRLWERRRGDADHLLIRVGTATPRGYLRVQFGEARWTAWPPVSPALRAMR